LLARLPIKLCVAVLKFWHLFSAKLFGQACRFEPSCSVYAVEALEQHGFFRGWYLAIKRVCRCHPLSAGGEDSVPKK